MPAQPNDPLSDPGRLAALRRARLLDTPPEEAFDQLARLAARLLRAPQALVTLVEPDRQFFKSAIGVSEPWQSARGTPISHSFCRYAVASGTPFVVDDAREHPEVRNNPAIDDLGIYAYAGVPLVDDEGYALGTLCVVDSQPRHWTPEDIETLTVLAATVMSTIRSWAQRSAPVPDAAQADVPVDRRTGARMRAAGAALADASRALLEALDGYDSLVRTADTSSAHLDAEALALQLTHVARAHLREALAGTEEAVEQLVDADFVDPAHTSLAALRAAAADYLQQYDACSELGMQFQLGNAQLGDYEAACTDSVDAEFALRRAMAAYAGDR